MDLREWKEQEGLNEAEFAKELLMELFPIIVNGLEEAKADHWEMQAKFENYLYTLEMNKDKMLTYVEDIDFIA